MSQPVLNPRADRRTPLWICAAIIVAIFLFTGTIEHFNGRHLFYLHGPVHFWVSHVNGPENSQQIADWYSFSHIIHGMALYGILRLLTRKRLPRRWCLVLAVGIEAGWEMLENSSFIIDRYRKSGATSYYGDTILNSLSDISFCVLGFCLAAVLPVWVTIGLLVAMEIGVGWAIHDNLTLNIIMLIHPFQAIRRWQAGVG